MKYLLVKYTIHDGEHEYDEYIIAKTEKTKWSDTAVFKKALGENYFANKGNPLKPAHNVIEDKGMSFTLPTDYRIAELEWVSEICEEEANAISKHNIAWMMDY